MQDFAVGVAEYPEGIKSFSPTATRLQHSAQCCRDDLPRRSQTKAGGTATLGNGAQNLSTLKELQPTAAER